MNRSENIRTGDAIRAARTLRGLSLRELARSIEVSAATLSAIENGKTGMTVARLHTIAATLGTTADRLIRDHGRHDGTIGDQAPRPAPLPLPIESGTKDWRHYAPSDVDPMLGAAIEAFVETGYHGATMRLIAARAQISVAGLYHHYASKQELLVRILDLTMAELLWRVPAARDEGRDSIQRVGLIVECLALFHTHRSELAFLGASEMRSLEPANRRRIAALRTEIQRTLDAEIFAGVDHGLFRTRVPHEAGRAISTMCTSLPQWFQIGGALSPETIAKEYAELALGMLICR